MAKVNESDRDNSSPRGGKKVSRSAKQEVSRYEWGSNVVKQACDIYNTNRILFAIL